MSVIIHGLNMPRRSAVQVMIYPDGQAVVTKVMPISQEDLTITPKTSALCGIAGVLIAKEDD